MKAALLATMAAGCVYGAGPTLAVSRHGVSVGAQGGTGFGGRPGGVRLDGGAGVTIDAGADARGYGTIGGTAFLLFGDNKLRDTLTAGGIVTTAGYGTDGGFGGAGAIAARFDALEASPDNTGWSVSLTLCRVRGRYEVVLWPQRFGYTRTPGIGVQ